MQEGIANNANIINTNDKNYIKRFTENESKITQTEKDIKTQIEELSVTNKKLIRKEIRLMKFKRKQMKLFKMLMGQSKRSLLFRLS